ncbi:hypothetical protein GOBAR_DD03485 [Gossypium barbadense]|nr:hypothetical protein GOBAR_DD03485 [Gossypium barbadense]
MYCLAWNFRGLGNPQAIRSLQDLVFSNKLRWHKVDIDGAIYEVFGNASAGCIRRPPSSLESWLKRVILEMDSTKAIQVIQANPNSPT